MLKPPAPHARLVAVRAVATGQIEELWPVDARERVNQPDGGYELVLETPDPVPVVAPAPVDTSGVTRAALDEKAHADLRLLAKQVGVNANLKKSDMIDALLPHIAAGTLSIAPVTMMPPTLAAARSFET